MSPAPIEPGGHPPAESAGGLLRLTTTRPVAILMMLVAVVVFGLVSYGRLSLNLMPDITYPSLTIRTEYPGAAPEEVENLISRPIEEAVGVIDNLVSVNSISKSEISDVVLEFTWDTDMNVATQDVREKLDPIFFPDGADKPIILRYDPSLDPVMRLGVYGIDDLYLLRKICDEDVKRDLEGIPGVAAVKVKGGLEEEMRVDLDERRLAARGLDIGEVERRLAQENINLAGGKLKEGEAEYLVRTFNEFRGLDEIRDVVVARSNGVDVRVKDVGRVWRGHTEREVITRVDGHESVEIEIHKEADANAVEVARLVREALYGTAAQRAWVERMEGEAAEPAPDARGPAGKDVEPGGAGGKNGQEKVRQIKREKAAASAMRAGMTDFIRYRLPKAVDVVTLSDQSVFIENSVKEVRDTALYGGLLAILVLYLFLRRLSTTLIVGVSIPVSIIATFACMHIGGVSLNIMSLGGLALGVGMLVDNSIVVIESIFRCREEGDGVVESALRGVREVSGAVIASTLTTIAVFFPIVFVQGVAGQIFGDMSLTVVFALLMSLAVSLFVIPMMASRRLGGEARGRQRKADGGTGFLRFRSLSGFGSKAPGAGKAGEGGLSRAGRIALLVREVAEKLLLCLMTLVEIALKAAAGFLYLGLLLLVPLLLLAARLRGRRRVTASAWVDRAAVWLAADRGAIPGRRPAAAYVQAGLVSFRSPGMLRDGLCGLGAWARRRMNPGGRGPASRAAGWIAILAGLPLAFLYRVVRFLIHHLFSTLGKIGVLLIHLGAVVGIAAGALAGALLAPFVGVLLFLFERGYGRIQAAYPRLLERAVSNPGGVVSAAAIPFAVTIFVLLPRIGRELIPEVHQGEFNVEVALPVGTPLASTLEAVAPIERMLMAEPHVEKVATVVGVEKKSNPGADEGENTAKVTVRLDREGETAEREEAMIHDIRPRLRRVPEMEVKVSRPTLFSFKTPVEVEIRGYDLATLARVSRDLRSRMMEVPGLSDVRANLQRGYPEVQIRYDRDQLARFGLTVFDVASLVRTKVLGAVATEFREEDRKIDIRVRLRDADRQNIEDLSRLTVNPGGAVPIPLSAVADIRVREGPSEIRRVDQQRAALVTANLDGIDLGTATREIYGILDDVKMPADFSWRIGGQNREMETSLRSLLFAMALAIFLVYVVMASQFESLLHPFVIVFTVPLALIGVILTLWVAGISISVMVFIGLIMLVGIVVNNAIVLIDYINNLRRRGMERTEAILLAGRVRLRPILMTTMTTVLGLLPMALGAGEGAEIRAPMAITVIAGLISGTLLTLIVIPTIYNVVARGGGTTRESGR